MKRFRQRKAFTIVEMVIVIAVIAILATVLVPTFGGIIQKANHSADTQFVASLNVQLAMWQVDHGEIANESDLREAINYYYGDEGAVDYYATLSPKSAPQGYHYWWNVAEKRVDLKAVTIDDIPDTALASTEDIEFDINNPRCFTFKDGNTYLLMDRKGDNALTNAVEKMDAMSGSGEFGALVALLKSEQKTPVDQGLYNMLLSNLQSVAVFNHGGIFSFNTEISHLYIPQTAQTLGTSHYVCTDGSVTSGTHTYAATLEKVYVPSSVKFLEGSAIFGRTGVAADNPLRNGAIELHMNIDAGDLGNHFDIAATDCVIVLPTGRYVQNGNGFDLLTATGANKVDGATSKYTVTVESFQVNPTNSQKAVIEDGKIYIAEDAGSVTLNAHTFVGKDQTGAEVRDFAPGTITLSIGDEKITGTDSVTFNLSAVQEDTVITIMVQEVSYSYTVKIDTVESVHSVTINGISKDGFSVSNANNYAYNIDYKTGDSWIVAFKTTQKYSKTIVDAFSFTSDDLTVLEPVANEKKLTVKAASGLQTADITITCGSASKVCEVTLIDATKLAFDVNNNVNTQGKYGLTLTLGTEGSMTLSELFTATDDLDEFGDYVYINYKNGSSKVLKENWATYDILSNDIRDSETSEALFGKDAANGKTATLEISIGNSTDKTNQKKLTITLVKGAKNVKSASDWSNVNGQSLVLLTDLKNFADGAGMITVTNGTVYGNLHKIYWEDGTYLVKAKADNAIITLNNGTIDNLVIDGPVYNLVSWYNKTDSSSPTTSGMYVVGVYAIGESTISNSYISGFRSPVATGSASTKININNTTLKGGAVANIYLKAKSVHLDIDNSTMIQYAEAGLVGAGIYLDEQATSTVIEMTNTMQYTFASEDEMNKLPAVNALGSTAGKLIAGYLKSNVGIHKINDTDYLHTGVLMHAKASVSGWSSGKDYTISGQTYKHYSGSALGQGAKITCIKGGSSNCISSCSAHTLTPTWGSSATDYLTEFRAID